MFHAYLSYLIRRRLLEISLKWENFPEKVNLLLIGYQDFPLIK